jgi:hypothetical protein
MSMDAVVEVVWGNCVVCRYTGSTSPQLSGSSIPLQTKSMSLWHNPAYDHSKQSKMPASSTVNPLEMFTSCAISNIAVGDATIHTLYRPAQPGASDIVLVLIHGYPQTHIMWRSVWSLLYS